MTFFKHLLNNNGVLFHKGIGYIRLKLNNIFVFMWNRFIVGLALHVEFDDKNLILVT